MDAQKKQDEEIARALHEGLNPNTSQTTKRRPAEEETKVEPPPVPQTPKTLPPASMRVLQAFVERAVKQGPKPSKRDEIGYHKGSPNTLSKPKTPPFSEN